MAIKVTLPKTGGFTISDLIGVIDYLAVDAEASSISTTAVIGTGRYGGSAISFSLFGSGFTLGTIGADEYLTAGTLDRIVFTSATSGTINFTNINIDMSVFSPIIAKEDAGTSTTAIEKFLMGKAWDITLGNSADIAPKGTLVGDGVAFNTTKGDILRGKGGNDNLFTGNGNDKLFGDAGHDKLDGGNGNDLIRGGAGRDILKGGAHKDVLDGGKHNDVLTGGSGPDKFVFKNNYGRDKVTDFNAKNNREDIDLKAVSAIRNFKDLKNNHMKQDGADVVIDDGAATEITLVGVSLGDLGKGDFIF